jgi:serine protease Do
MTPHLVDVAERTISRKKVAGQPPARWLRLAVTGLAMLLLSATWARAGGNGRRTAVVEVVERVKAAVVNIRSERTVGQVSEEMFSLAPSQNRINGMGTGIIIDPRGYIVTNQHVVDDVNVISIRLADGTSASARVIARDADSDLALLKIDTSRPLPVVPFGTASDLMVGETVIAIGNAYGYEHTVTVGVVSALKRDVTLNKDISYKSLIQTDASINPGNSGGPLLNINGELIGVNVAIRAGAQGIGFAIPVDNMIRVTADMFAARRKNGTWHGMICRDRLEPIHAAKTKAGVAGDALTSLAPVTDAGTETTGAPTEVLGQRRELLVERVDSSGPAARAGLKNGDVLTRVGNMAVTCSLDLERAMLDRNIGDKVPVSLLRDGAEKRVELVLQDSEKTNPHAADLAWKKLGVKLSPVAAEFVNRANPQLRGGLLVLDLRADSTAAKAGLQRGDILIGLHQWEMLSLDNVSFVLTHPDLASFNPLKFYLIRSGQVHRGWLQSID